MLNLAELSRIINLKELEYSNRCFRIVPITSQKFDFELLFDLFTVTGNLCRVCAA